ncbi:MAG TPA: hypothetical protein VJB12_01030 [Candidatus Nanoarchaeia archaeon]|nr:hypothetical protein [Candidatus Nanoarchaeia archaeon]
MITMLRTFKSFAPMGLKFQIIIQRRVYKVKDPEEIKGIAREGKSHASDFPQGMRVCAPFLTKWAKQAPKKRKWQFFIRKKRILQDSSMSLQNTMR